MTTKFQQVGPVQVEATRQDLSLQTDGSSGITEAASAIVDVIDESAVSSYRKNVMETVDQWETNVALPFKFDNNKTLTETEIAQVLGVDESRLRGADKEIKTLSRTLAQVRRAASQNKIDPEMLDVRMEAVTRQAIRRRPSLAREFAQINSLYGGSTMVQEVEALKRARGATSPEQEQMEKFIEDAVKAGTNRADYFKDPQKFFEQGIKNINAQNGHDLKKRTWEIADEDEKADVRQAKKAFPAYTNTAASKVRALVMEYKGFWSTPDQMRQAVQSNSQEYREFRFRLDQIKQDETQTAVEQFGVLGMDAVKQRMAVPFEMAESLISLNTPDEQFNSMERYYKALEREHFESQPQSAKEALYGLRMLGDGLKYVDFGSTSRLRGMIAPVVDSVMGFGNLDLASDSEHRRYLQNEGQTAEAWVEDYIGGAPEEKTQAETQVIEHLEQAARAFEAPVSGSDGREDLGVYSAATFLRQRLHFMNQEGVLPTERGADRLMKAMANPNYGAALASAASRSDPIRFELNSKENPIRGAVLTYARGLEEAIVSETSKRSLGFSPTASGVQLRTAPQLGTSVFLQYNTGVGGEFTLEYVDENGKPLSKYNRGADTVRAKDRLRDSIMATAHNRGSQDYWRGAYEVASQFERSDFLRLPE